MSSEGKIRRRERLSVLRILRLLSATIFLGYIVLWMISPTDRFWRHWLPKLRAQTSSTYFGSQGTNLLLFTSPILFIAVLGCLFIHLKNKTCSTQSGNAGSSFWKRPVLVRGPIGIVSWVEFIFLLMFVALLAWYFSVSLSASFSHISPQSAAENGEKIWQEKVEYAGLRIGLLGNLCVAFLFFPVTRGSSILPLVGLTSERSIRYHIWLGHLSMLLFTIHGLLYVIYWASTNSISKMLEWATAGVSNVAGELALLSGLVLWAATLPWVRRKMFEVFFYAHHLYILFLVFYVLHIGVAFFSLLLPGIYLFMIDRFIRFLQSRGRVRLISARLLPGETVELNFAKSPGLQYNPSSMVFLNIPAVSKLQWHPFTVSSNCNLEPETLSVIIKKEGSWTQKLHQILASAPPDRLEVSIEGPYSSVSDEISRYDSLILISGGSGITPFISIIRGFIFRSAATNNPTPRIHLVCAFKNTADLAMLDLLLPISEFHSDLSQLNLKISAFITRDQKPYKKVAPPTILLFKPRPTDKPLAHILGPYCSLSLAAIISISFLSFLLLLGILNKFYIYPKDHNTNSIYPYAAKAFLNLLLVWGAIGLSTTLVFLWNKWQYSRCESTVGFSPSKNIVVEQELETQPKESLSNSTHLHFQGRPNIKKILLEHEEEDVGVFVSGPKEMRRDVARICSSGIADNLHYSSMSFNW
ncbi:ferric reduction oxidase 2-like [Wolffia australiana]